MAAEESHLSDQTLLMAIDGELSAVDEARVQSHIAGCWDCRTRKQEMEGAIGEFMRLHRRLDPQIPPSAGPRALLKARLAEVAGTQRPSWLHRLRTSPLRMSWMILGAACAVAAMTFFISRLWNAQTAEPVVSVAVPNPSLTPGATVLESWREVCNDSNANNKAVPVALRRRIFDEYGIRTADPSAYEIDYLVTPALGGADDIHNLWPQSKKATVWNAQVKDALEDHLRDLVCEGQLDLVTAQREIATNWIDAYKKYFHTDQPLTRFR
ncbi:MAG: zf-HC2 domain-containing protein [Bryobacteraceae bacterium]